MLNSQKFHQFITLFSGRAIKLFSISLLLFVASPNYAFAYGGHGYHQGYGHQYGHRGYRNYGYSANYSHHGHIGTAGYVFLGILGVAVLSQILDNNNDRDRRYRKYTTYNQPPIPPRRVANNRKPKTTPVYSYSDNEGWDWLAKGNAGYALDIFAIQSQQNLHSGIPKVGFAIAAAASGDTDRATRAMRKAIRTDATALDKININNIKPTIETLTENYQLGLNNDTNNTDNAFMVATLSYLQQDYATANNIISENDHSQSANKLRELIAKKSG